MQKGSLFTLCIFFLFNSYRCNYQRCCSENKAGDRFLLKWLVLIINISQWALQEVTTERERATWFNWHLVQCHLTSLIVIEIKFEARNKDLSYSTEAPNRRGTSKTRIKPRKSSEHD